MRERAPQPIRGDTAAGEPLPGDAPRGRNRATLRVPCEGRGPSCWRRSCQGQLSLHDSRSVFMPPPWVVPRRHSCPPRGAQIPKISFGRVVISCRRRKCASAHNGWVLSPRGGKSRNMPSEGFRPVRPEAGMRQFMHGTSIAARRRCAMLFLWDTSQRGSANDLLHMVCRRSLQTAIVCGSHRFDDLPEGSSRPHRG